MSEETYPFYCKPILYFLSSVFKFTTTYYGLLCPIKERKRMLILQRSKIASISQAITDDKYYMCQSTSSLTLG